MIFVLLFPLIDPHQECWQASLYELLVLYDNNGYYGFCYWFSDGDASQGNLSFDSQYFRHG